MHSLFEIQHLSYAYHTMQGETAALSDITFTVNTGNYEPERFVAEVKGLEHVPEGGIRCEKCFVLRLSETAKLAQAHGFDYFTTSLTISPLKNATLLNEVGEAVAAEYCHGATAFLNSDFKKKNGYKRSVELSELYGLYRQDYCGCLLASPNFIPFAISLCIL